MGRKLIKNPVFGGMHAKKATIRDLVYLKTDRKYKNPLFSFIIAIDGDFKNLSIEDSKNITNTTTSRWTKIKL